MKTIRNILLTLAVLLAGAAAAQTITVGSGTATCGSVRQVDLSIGTFAGIESIELEIGYDPGKLSVTEDVAGGSLNMLLADDHATPGKVTIILIAGKPVSGPATIATVKFNVAAAASGTANISISSVKVNGAAASGVAGALTISCSGGGDPPPASGHTLTAGTASGTCGGTVDVPVSISGGTPVESVQFTVSAGSGLTFAGATATGKAQGFLLETNPTTGMVVLIGTSAITGPGEIATLKFSVGATATGSLAVTLSDVKVNGKDASNATGSVTAACGGTPNPPNTPTYISPVHESTGIAAPVTLRWNGVSGASTYRVFFGTTDPPPLHNATDRTRLDVATQQGTIYYWSVEAVAAGGKVAGPVWKFTTAGTNCMLPSAPQLIGPVTDIASGSTFSLIWSITTGVTEYVLEEAGDATFTNAGTSTHTTSSATRVFWFSYPVTRFFRVRGRNTAPPCSAEGPVSNSVAVHIIPNSTGNSSGARVIAVAGSSPGTNGAYFRTSLQLHNHTAAMMRGRLIFHRQSASGSNNDPSLNYDIPPGVTRSISDVVVAFGAQSGIGSIDLVTFEGEAPLTVARIYNDAGERGTSGVAIETVATADALQAGQRAQLFAPIDPARARMNIGVRSLGDGATLEFTLRDYAGIARQSARRSFNATWFEQFAIGSLFDTPLRGDEMVVVEVVSGSAIVYASTTDNVTQDPTIQFARAR